MHDNVEKIIEELYTIDPSLKESSADIRVLVSALIASKPEVTISATFIENLRKELLWKAEGSLRAKKAHVVSPFSWWLIRLAPIGAFAVLMLMLLPEPAGSPTTTPSYIDTYRQIETSDSDAMFKSTLTAPETQTQLVQNPIVLDSVTLTRPGFIVVETNLGEVLGVSKYLSSGTTVGIYINLSRIPDTTEVFSTVQYIDNGDGIFTQEKDTVAQ